MFRSNIRIYVSILAAGLCLAIVLSILPTGSSATIADVQDMRGVWNGFIQAGVDPPDPVRTEITSQEGRRFTGFTNPPDPVQPVEIEGTVSASGKVNYQSKSSDIHLVGKHDLIDFGGGAAILNGDLTRPSVDGKFIVPCVLVMRPFAADGSALPNLAGRYDGSISSEDGVQGQINMVLGAPPDPIRGTGFEGTLEIVIDRQTYSFQLLGTANSSGRIIAIAHQAGAGHVILNAVLASPPDPVQPPTINGTFTLEFGDGSELEGAFQTAFSRAT